MSVEKQDSESKDKGIKDWIEDLYPFLNMFLGLDSKLQGYLEDNPDVAKAVYYQTREIGGDFASEEARIDEEQLKEEIAVEQKSFLLLNDWVGDSLNDKNSKNLVGFLPVENAKKYYRALSKMESSYKATEVEGFPHMILPERIRRMAMFDYYRLATDKENTHDLADDLRESGAQGSFPFPLGGRVVLRQDFAPVVMAVLEKKAKSVGKEVTLLLPGEVETAPSKDECQIILAPSAETMRAVLDWELVSKYAQIWDDKEVPAVGWSPELVSAIYVSKGQTPEEACKTAGLEHPKEAFLKELAKYTAQPELAVDATLDAVADAVPDVSDTSDEDLDRAL